MCFRLVEHQAVLGGTVKQDMKEAKILSENIILNSVLCAELERMGFMRLKNPSNPEPLTTIGSCCHSLQTQKKLAMKSSSVTSSGTSKENIRAALRNAVTDGGQ